MPSNPVFAHGLKGQISINSSAYYGMTGDYAEDTTIEDITYGVPGNATYGVQIPGYVTAKGTINAIWDTANKPYLSPYLIYAGALLSLIINPDNSSPYSFSCYVGSFGWKTGPTAGAIKLNFTYTSTGTITRPSS